MGPLSPCFVSGGGFLNTVIVPGDDFCPFESCPGEGGWFGEVLQH